MSEQWKWFCWDCEEEFFSPAIVAVYDPGDGNRATVFKECPNCGSEDIFGYRIKKGKDPW